MSSTQNQPSQSYPAVPHTLAAGDHDLDNYYSDSQAPATTTPQYTPYLGLRARLSQVWINRWTVLLLLILLRLLISIAGISDDITSAKREALQACTSVEKVGSAMASMPHYLSQGVNAMAADGVTEAVNALMSMLLLTITGVGELVLFIINMLTSTYVCLITLVVAGSLQVALDMIKKVTEFTESSIESITGEMSGTLESFQNGLNGFIGGLDKIGGFFGGDTEEPPKIDLSSQITKLKEIDIDTSKFTADLDKLKEQIPDFAEVQNFTNAAIRFPFDQVKKLINESMSVYTFDKTVFPVAQKKRLTFCTDNPAINDFFDGLIDVIYKARTVFLAVLVILAVGVCVPMAYREIWRWRTMQQRAIMLQKNAFDPMDVIYIASRPYTTTIGIKASSVFKSTKRQILVRWFVAYATSLPALFVLSLGLAGLFSCLCQLIVLKVIEKEVPALAGEVGDFTEHVVLALNNASQEWAVGANGVMTSTGTKINEEVFGWVNTTTSSVNDTLNTFTAEMAKALDVAFGGTILHDPIKEVLNCLIGLKVIAVQKGLTWVSEHAHISFPQLRPDVFSLGAAASLTNSTEDDAFLASPGSVASDDITAAVIKVSIKLQGMIRQEAIISACIVGLWFVIMLIGLGRVIVGLLARDKTRGEGGPVGYTGDNRTPISPRSPNRQDMSHSPGYGGPVSSVHPEKSSDNLAFGPGGSGEDEKFGGVEHRGVEASQQPGQAGGYNDVKY